MHNISKVFLSVLFILIVSTYNVWAVESACSPVCNEDQFCSTNNGMNGPDCQSCTNIPNGATPQGPGEDDNPNSCPWTLTCGNKPDFYHGTWAPDVATITYDGTGDQPTGCTYNNTNNITCTNSNDPCDGYHVEDNSCVSNKASCSSETGIKVWTGNNYSSCHITSCNTGYYFDKTGTICGHDEGVCYNAGTSCANVLSDSAHCDTITGNISTTGGFSNCKCKKTENIIVNGTTVGKRTITRQYVGHSGNTPSWNDEQPIVDQCFAGYYASGSTCTQTEVGYYSAANEKDQHKCPFSSTCNAGSTSITACHFAAGITITDNHGSYTLPVDANLSATLRNNQ